MKRIIFFSFLGGLLLVSGCSKFESVKHFKMDAAVRSYFQYKEGSKWEYVLESDSNVRETTTVVNYLEGKMVWDAFDQEFFEYNLSSTRDSSLKLRAIADDKELSRASLIVKDTSYKLALQWTFAGGIYAAVSGTGDTLKTYSSKMVRGISYSDVMEFIPAKKVFYRNVWFAKNVGIIRKQRLNGEVMLLRSFSLL